MSRRWRRSDDDYDYDYDDEDDHGDDLDDIVLWSLMIITLIIVCRGLVAVIKWLFTRRERPVRLFWDMENARCTIPKRASFEQCANHLRGIASQHGVDLREKYSIKIICGGFDGNNRCSQNKCIHAAKVCSSEILETWSAGSTVPTRVEGVMIQYCWEGNMWYQKNKADKAILQQLHDLFTQDVNQKMKVIIVSVDYRLRQQAREAVVLSSKQSVVLHPELFSQDGVWPDEYYEKPSEKCIIN